MDALSSNMLVYFAIILGLLVSGYLITTQAYRVYQGSFTQKANTELGNMYIFWDADKLFFLNLLALCLVPLIVYLYSDSYFYVGLSVVMLIVLPRLLYLRMRKKRLQTFEMSLPDALAQMAGSMRAGATFIGSLEHMVQETRGPIQQEFTLFLQELRLGIGTDLAMQKLTKRVPSENLLIMASATLIAKDLGGNLAEVYGRLSDTLRQKITMEAKIDALTSQGRMQGWVVGMLPFAIILILQSMEPESMQYLTTGLLGWVFLGIIILMEILGLLMIRKIITIDV
ncbi:type II secretion system F family protein [Allohahella sp. A8]|uniref:type II secretion system F family protein n=1 Tax=Allohahella sp. A8 TaxID=3141461 RepID=UPI003A7F8399